MKIYTKTIILAILALIISVPLLTNAEEAVTEAVAPTSIRETPPKPPAPPSASVLENLRKEAKLRAENIKINQEIRKNKIEDRKEIASTSKAMIKDIRSEARDGIKLASSSTERKEIRKDMRRDLFKIEKEKILKQLEISMENLKQIRNRVESRIKKEQQNGKNMSNAIKLLGEADTKINIAKNAIKSFKEYDPRPMSLNASTTLVENSSSTQSINLDTARQLSQNAQKAIKDAHKAITDVVTAIAQSMGVKLGNPLEKASSTPATTE